MVEEGDDYYHVRFSDPDEFEEIRTPDWANDPAGSVVSGSDWIVQSVLIPLDAVESEDDASRRALEIASKIAD
jgi:hypothetical protein